MLIKNKTESFLASIFQPAYHAQKLPHNIFNTKTTGSLVLSQENKHNFFFPVNIF